MIAHKRLTVIEDEEETQETQPYSIHEEEKQEDEEEQGGGSGIEEEYEDTMPIQMVVDDSNEVIRKFKGRTRAKRSPTKTSPSSRTSPTKSSPSSRTSPTNQPKKPSPSAKSSTIQSSIRSLSRQSDVCLSFDLETLTKKFQDR